MAKMHPVLATAVAALTLSSVGLHAQTDLPPRRVVFNLSACIAPEMPKAAVDAGVGGEVRAQFTVDEAGAIVDPRIIQSAGESPAHKAIDAAVIQSLRSCVFPPSPGFAAAQMTQAFNFKVVEPRKGDGLSGYRSVTRGTETCSTLQRPAETKEPFIVGITQVQFVVDSEGVVHNPRVTHPSGLTYAHSLLDAEAMRHIATCRFPPAQGKAPPVRWSYDWNAQ